MNKDTRIISEFTIISKNSIATTELGKMTYLGKLVRRNLTPCLCIVKKYFSNETALVTAAV